MPEPVHVGPQGRIVIPAALRKAMRLKQGDDLVARVEDGTLILETRAAVLRRIQKAFAAVAPGESLVDGLIAERRAEAARERLD